MNTDETAAETPAVELEMPEAEASEAPAAKSAPKAKSPYLRCLVKKDAGVGGIKLRKGATVVLKRSVAERALVLNAVTFLGDEWK
jgi:hypothetical protein